MNCLTIHADFFSTVNAVWQQEVCGQPMYVLWRKLQLLQGRLKPLTIKHLGIPHKLEEAQPKLRRVQQELLQDRFNVQLIQQVKECT